MFSGGAALGALASGLFLDTYGRRLYFFPLPPVPPRPRLRPLPDPRSPIPESSCLSSWIPLINHSIKNSLGANLACTLARSYPRPALAHTRTQYNPSWSRVIDFRSDIASLSSEAFYDAHRAHCFRNCDRDDECWRASVPGGMRIWYGTCPPPPFWPSCLV